MTLIEVLVAVFIMSIAMLGIATLQVTSKRTNFESVQRTNATMLAQTLIERIRANTDQLTVYTNAGAGRTINLSGSDNITQTNCASAACTTASLAMYDLYEFRQALLGVAEASGGSNTGGLIEPTVCITGPVVTPGAVSLAIAWRGLTRLSNPTADNCGAGSGKYDEGAAADVYRRLLVMDTFVD
jgi:type IV pilus assembly protein PilV